MARLFKGWFEEGGRFMTVIETSPREALVERLLGACIGGLDLLHIHVGNELGLYRALASAGSLGAAGLAEQCAVSERYAKEWLEQQAVAGILTVEATNGDRRFALPAGHIEVLLDADSLSYLAPLASLFVSMTVPLARVIEAFRSGGGVPYEAYGPEVRRGIASLNRPDVLEPARRGVVPTGSRPHRASRCRPSGESGRRRLRLRMVEHRHRPRLPHGLGHRPRPR